MREETPKEQYLTESDQILAAGNLMAHIADHSFVCRAYEREGPCDCGLDEALEAWKALGGIVPARHA